jgi:hypothetical protein
MQALPMLAWMNLSSDEDQYQEAPGILSSISASSVLKEIV